MLRFESFVFTCLTYWAYNNVQRFRNGPVHEFYGLKASQMSQGRATSHEYTHVEKIKNLREENFKGTVAQNCHGKRINLTAKTMTSRQKEKHYDERKKTHDEKNNLTTKRITQTSRQKKKELKCPLGIEEILP